MGCSRDTVFFTGCFLLCRKTLCEAACKMAGAVEDPDGSHGNPVRQRRIGSISYGLCKVLPAFYKNDERERRKR